MARPVRHRKTHGFRNNPDGGEDRWELRARSTRPHASGPAQTGCHSLHAAGRTPPVRSEGRLGQTLGGYRSLPRHAQRPKL
ncbi:hypothetical protein ACFPRL_34430 [Pseudoclavibacter helvolus]